jgi:hypothetical protein
MVPDIVRPPSRQILEAALYRIAGHWKLSGINAADYRELGAIEGIAHELAHALDLGPAFEAQIRDMANSEANNHEAVALRIEAAALTALGVHLSMRRLRAYANWRNAPLPSIMQLQAPLTSHEQHCVKRFVSMAVGEAKRPFVSAGEQNMNRANINVSGACGSGSSVKIYETPDCNYPWHGASVMHGSFTAGPTSPDGQRIETVELCLPGLDIRVRADAVRTELRALLSANKASEVADWSALLSANKASEVADWSAELQPARHLAFAALQAAMFGIAGRKITVEHIERIAHATYADGLRHGEKAKRGQFRTVLGL